MEHKILQKTNKNKKQQKNVDSLVDFYLQPEFIQLISQQLASQEATDHQKIETIKQAIQNNTLKIDPEKLAQKIINFENDF